MNESNRSLASLRSDLESWYRAAVGAVDAGAALEPTLEGISPPGPIHLLAVGKAAGAMAATALRWLRRHGPGPASGLIVSPERIAPPPDGVMAVAGNHPQPGNDSFAAARSVSAFVAGVEPDHHVWVMLSGGATSLIAAPVPGVSEPDLAMLFERVGRAGLDIHALNAVRKRFVQWGAGRLARALAPAPCRTFAISDVPGDTIPSIGSGPTSPDESTIEEVVTILDGAGLIPRLPPTVVANIAGIRRGEIEETPKPGDAAFAGADATIIARNADACDAAAAAARHHGYAVTAGETLTGDAAEAGRRIATMMIQQRASAGSGRNCVVLGGETVVRLEARHGRGGRCQQLALAAAEVFATASDAGLMLMAAGTDGRDGPTDAAGAIVDPGTWKAISAAGRDPRADLERQAAYEALAAAGALFRPGPTGTNVMDLVIGIY